MGRRMKALNAWTARHSVALDVGVVAFLVAGLLVDLAFWEGWPWGFLKVGVLLSALAFRLWALAWAKGYTSAALQSQDLIARQAATLELQSQALKNTVQVPAVFMDDATKQVVVRTFISLN